MLNLDLPIGPKEVRTSDSCTPHKDSHFKKICSLNNNPTLAKLAFFLSIYNCKNFNLSDCDYCFHFTVHAAWVTWCCLDIYGEIILKYRC